MAKYLIDDASLITIADAIRSKTGETATLSLAEMASRIDQLGGGDTAIVDSIIDGSITELNSNVVAIRDYAFYRYTGLTTVDFPLVPSIGNYAFANCTGLTTVNFPLVTSIGIGAFDSCKILTTVDFPLVTSIGSGAFSSCKKLTTVNFPLVTSIDSSAFSQCSLVTADFPLVTSIGGSAFRYNSLLKNLILRNDVMCLLTGSDALSNCNNFRHIYVPSALIESYKTATNWSTYASKFRALEDYTVDGTITGELDETKI